MAMRNRFTTPIFLCLFAAIVLGGWALPASPRALAKSVGGPCAYDDFPGTATILSVEPIPQSGNLLERPPYQPYRVLFTFAPAKPVPHPLYQPGKAHELTLSGGTPPGPAFLKKYGIGPGAAFKTELHLIASGTCSPVAFTFHGIDVFDRFEFKRQ